MQGGPVDVVKIVAVNRDDTVYQLEVDDIAFGTIGRLVEHESSVPNMSPERLHRG
jgi:hypothetical protein